MERTDVVRWRGEGRMRKFVSYCERPMDVIWVTAVGTVLTSAAEHMV